MSLQQYAIGNGMRMRLLDCQPSGDTRICDAAGGPDGKRWTPADGSPVELPEMDYSDGATMCERNPRRFRPARMSDVEHQAMIAAFEESRK
jgi:hypothetical protein